MLSPDRRRPARTRPRGVVRALVVAGAIALATAGCADDSPLLDVPSVQTAPAPPADAEAVDSSRAVIRRVIEAQYLPGVSVAVGRRGQIVWAEAFGWADLSLQVAATPATLYPVGSISKPLTAAAAGILHQQGRLDFDVPVQTYLPDFPEKRWPFTLRQVMGHNSGIMRTYGLGELLRQDGCPDARSGLDAFAEDTLLFEPGTEHLYSNFGYRLVGAAVEAAAGEPYLDFMKREVFDRAGMETTVPDLGDEGPDEAVKYVRGPFSALQASEGIDMSCSMAPGGFLSTPTELVRFGYAMVYGTVLDPSTVDLFWTSQQLVTGEPTGYGFGWSVGMSRIGDDVRASTPTIGHGGSVPGGRASLLILREPELIVAVQTNATGNIGGLAERIAGFFRTPPPAATASPEASGTAPPSRPAAAPEGGSSDR